MPSQSSNSNGSYSVTSSGTNSQVCVRNNSKATTHQTRASPTNTFLNRPLNQLAKKKKSQPFLPTKQGNSYDSRDYGSSASNQNSYHYSNSDGSYYYSNPNGKTRISLLPSEHYISKRRVDFRFLFSPS